MAAAYTVLVLLLQSGHTSLRTSGSGLGRPESAAGLGGLPPSGVVNIGTNLTPPVPGVSLVHIVSSISWSVVVLLYAPPYLRALVSCPLRAEQLVPMDRYLACYHVARGPRGPSVSVVPLRMITLTCINFLVLECM